MERRIVVSVCKTNSGFSAHIDTLSGVIATGKTLDDIKENMYEALRLHLEGMKEDGELIPVEFQGEYEVLFKMDVESLLDYYQGIIPQSAIARLTGINVKQLNHYATGKSKPRAEQIRKIEKGLHDLGSELLQLQL